MSFKRAVFTLSCLSLLITSVNISAQEVESDFLPDATGINQLQTSANLSSGVLNISLPIESHLIPISIGYSTGGIRVNQKPSVVGLGWNLSAGGFVQRQKRGLADDATNGYSGENARGSLVSTAATAEAFYAQAFLPTRDLGPSSLNDQWDEHPDLYSFQFPGGSGFFTLDHNRNVIKLSQNDFKISVVHTATSGFTQFEIIDTGGNEYVFGVRESVTESRDDEDWETYTSKWKLSTVTRYDDDSEIVLSYTEGNIHVRGSATTAETTLMSDTGESNTQIIRGSLSGNLQLLSSISYLNHSISFTYSDIDLSYNEDYQPQKLDEITYSKNGIELVSYSFDYNYLGLRLMLSGVKKSSLDVFLYQFVYNGYDNNPSVTSLPVRSSYPAYSSWNDDHWGFYNQSGETRTFVHKGANRRPSLVKACANTLAAIFSTAGGYVKYNYELNSYLDENGNETAAGGLRIKEIYGGHHYNDLSLRTSYVYEDELGVCSGELFSQPVYYSATRSASENYHSYSDNALNNLSDFLGRHVNYEQVSVVNADGSYVRNTFHTFADDVLLFGTGNNSNLRVDKFVLTANSGLDIYSPNYSSYNPFFVGPFGYQSFRGTSIGMLKKVEAYDDEEHILSQTIYDYSTVLGADVLWGMNARVSSTQSPVEKYFNVDFYNLRLGYQKLDGINATTYDLEDETRKLTVETDYIYNSNYNLVDRTETYLSGQYGERTIQETDYLIDDLTSAFYTTLENDNRIAQVKEQRNYKGSLLRSTSINSFSLQSGKVFLEGTKSYSGAANLTNLISDVSYQKISGTGVVNEATNNISNTSASKIWNEDNTQVIASTSNATSGLSAFTSFEGDHTGNWSYALSSTSGIHNGKAHALSGRNVSKDLIGGTKYILSYFRSGTVYFSGLTSNTLLRSKVLHGWTFEERLISRASAGTFYVSGSGTAKIDELKLSPTDAAMTTATYHPLFGTSCSSDMNNRYVYYDYDAVGRLIATRDDDYNIVATTDYNITKFIDLSETTQEIDSKAGEIEVSVLSNSTWTVSENEAWLSVTKDLSKSNEELVIDVNKNTSTTDREGYVTVSTDDMDKTIIVKQSGRPTGNFLSVGETSIFVISAPEDFDLNVYCNGGWTATIVSKTNCYLYLSNGSGTGDVISGSNDDLFTVQVVNTDNTVGYSTSAMIRVVSDDDSGLAITIPVIFSNIF